MNLFWKNISERAQKKDFGHSFFYMEILDRLHFRHSGQRNELSILFHHRKIRRETARFERYRPPGNDDYRLQLHHTVSRSAAADGVFAKGRKRDFQIA